MAHVLSSGVAVSRMILVTLLGVLPLWACTTGTGGGGGGGGTWNFGNEDVLAQVDNGPTPDTAKPDATVTPDVAADIDPVDTFVEEIRYDGEDLDDTEPPLTDVQDTVAPDAVDDVDDAADASDQDVPIELPKGTASVSGLVLDENNLPIKGAKVIYVDVGNETLTDGAGKFSLQKIVAHDAARLRFEMPGYASFEKPVRLLHNEGSVVRVRMLEQGPEQVVLPKFGGVVHHSRGNVQFKPGTIVDAQGQPIKGEVRVRMTHVDPGTTQIEGAPGNFLGRQTDGTLSIIESFAMAEIAMTDENGDPVELAAGKTATLDMDLPVITTAKLGDTIAMWHYLEAKKMWIEEGMAKIVKSTRDPKRLAMVADVGHFSWWNCDKAGNARCISGTITGCDGEPLAGVTIEAKGAGANVHDGDSSKSDGKYCVMGYLGQKTIVTYRLGNRIAKEVELVPQGPGAFCGGGCLNQPDVQVCFNGCSRGNVVDSGGLAIPGAQVYVPKYASGKATEDPMAFSDDLGGFKVEALTLDPMKVQVVKPGYLPGEVNSVPVKGALDGGTCPAQPDTIVLDQPCLAGTVLSSSGEPLAGAQVVFEPYGKLPVSPVSTTGPDGKYQVRGPLGATGKLTVQAANHWPAVQVLKLTATQACSAKTAQLVPAVTLTGWGCLTGTVTDPNGVGLEGVQVAGGANGGSQLVTTGPGGTFCMEGPVGAPMQVGASGAGLAGAIQTVQIGKGGTCGGATCGETTVSLQMKPTVFEHLEGFWKDCQTVLGDVQVADLQVKGAAAGLEQIQGMHAVGFQEADGTRRIAIILSDAAGPAVLGKGKSLWFTEMAIGPYNAAQVVTYNLPGIGADGPNATTRLRGQIMSKTGGKLGIDASLYRLSETQPSTMTVVFGAEGGKAAEGFFDLTFESECGVGSGTARVKGSFVIQKLLQLPLTDTTTAAYQAWQKCYEGYDSPTYWTSAKIGAVDAITVNGVDKLAANATGQIMYAARDKGLLADAAVPTEGLAMSYIGSDVKLTGDFPKLLIGKNALGLGAFCGNLGFLDCCSGSPEQPVALSCGTGNVDAKVGGCQTFGVPACPANIGGATMSVQVGSCIYKLEPEDADITLKGIGSIPMTGGLTGSLKATITKLASGNASTCKGANVSVDFTAATCRVAPATNLGFQHASDLTP